MKKTTLIRIPCLLFTLTFTYTLFSEATSAPNPVLDTEGKILQTGLDYYLVPVKKHQGGALKLALTGTQVCPLGIGPPINQKEVGLTVNFFPVNSRKGVIREFTDLNVEFTETYTICQHYSNVWRLDHYDPQKEDHVITNGGVKGNPGRDTISNWFKIEKYGAGYKFVFCPSVCNYCEVICKNVGIFVQNNGQKLLALSDEPLLVKFVRKV